MIFVGSPWPSDGMPGSSSVRPPSGTPIAATPRRAVSASELQWPWKSFMDLCRRRLRTMDSARSAESCCAVPTSRSLVLLPAALAALTFRRVVSSISIITNTAASAYSDYLTKKLPDRPDSKQHDFELNADRSDLPTATGPQHLLHRPLPRVLSPLRHRRPPTRALHQLSSTLRPAPGSSAGHLRIGTTTGHPRASALTRPRRRGVHQIRPNEI